MKDRVPLYPGRVKLTPVSGQKNTYDMVRADEPTQEGDPLSKKTLLTDATAAMFGLDATAVPDDVLVWIGNYNQYWWKRFDPVVHDYYSYESSTLGESYVSTIKPTVSSPVSISASYTTNEYGEMILLEPITVWDGTTNPGYNYARGKYVKLKNGIVWKADEASADISSYTSGSDTLYRLKVYKGAIKYTPTITAQTDHQFNGVYLQSSDRNAYPDIGIKDDGYKYQYVGVPFDNAVTSPKIEIVEYTGTGTYGSSNPNTLTFSRVPEIVFFKDGGNGYGIRAYAWGDTQFAGLVGNANYYLKASVEGTTMTWYVGGTSSSVATANTQMNVSGKKYKAIAVCR